jgi:hypothetical protein
MENTGDSWLSRTNAAGIVVESPNPPRRRGLETKSPPGRPKIEFLRQNPCFQPLRKQKGGEWKDKKSGFAEKNCVFLNNFTIIVSRN